MQSNAPTSEFSVFLVLFQKLLVTIQELVCFHVLFQYVQVVLCFTVHRAIIRYVLFFSCQLLIHIIHLKDEAQQQSMAQFNGVIRYNQTLQLDHIPVKQARMVRATATATTIQKYRINLTLLLPLLLFIYFITATIHDAVR